MNWRILLIASVVVLVLSACGGGGGEDDSPVTDEEDLSHLFSDPRVIEARGIVAQASGLQIPRAYFNVTVSAEGETERQTLVMTGSCSGTQCVLSGDGQQLTLGLGDMLATSTDDSNFRYGWVRDRDQFSIASVGGRSPIPSDILGNTNFVGKTHTYGMWGEYGFAAVEILDSVSFIQDFFGSWAYVVGTPSGSNPTGIGGATWHGPAFAGGAGVSNGTVSYGYREWGTATITMEDLSVPSVAVEFDIDVRGFEFGSPLWSDIPVSDGKFTVGTAGEDLLVGHFYGPGHQETYGTFDMGAYIGAFGAKRQ